MKSSGAQEKIGLAKNTEALLRQQIRDQYQRYLDRTKLKNEPLGRYLFEGKWLSPEEIKSSFRNLKKKDREIFLEILLLFAGLFGLSGFLILILYALL